MGDKKIQRIVHLHEPLMNKDHRQLDVLYIYTLFRPLMLDLLSQEQQCSRLFRSLVHTQQRSWVQSTRVHTERPGQTKGHNRPVWQLDDPISHVAVIYGCIV